MTKNNYFTAEFYGGFKHGTTMAIKEPLPMIRFRQLVPPAVAIDFSASNEIDVMHTKEIIYNRVGKISDEGVLLYELQET